MEKSQFLDFLKFLFYGVENRFFVLEYRKTHFPGLYYLKRKLEKWSFLDQNHGLTHLEKSQFLDCLKGLFLWRTISFSGSKMSLNIFFWPILPEPLWKNLNFSTFWNSCFYSLERRFFVLKYRKTHFPGVYGRKRKSWRNGHFWTKTMR